MVVSALRRLHQTATERIRASVVDADADLVADQSGVPREVHELVPAGPTADDGRRRRSVGGPIARALRVVVMLVRARRSDGVHEDVDLAPDPRAVAFEPDPFLDREELVGAGV